MPQLRLSWKSILLSILLSGVWLLMSQSMNVFWISVGISLVSNYHEENIRDTILRSVICGLLVMVGDIYFYHLK